MENEVENLVLNMSGGLLPENLSKTEVELLKTRYGSNWFNKLGYTEPRYRRSHFDKHSPESK